jgi:hypothetical protein
MSWDPTQSPRRKKPFRKRRWQKKQWNCTALFGGSGGAGGGSTSAALLARRRKKYRPPRPIPQGRSIPAGLLLVPVVPGWVESARGTTFMECSRATTWTAPTMSILVKRAAESRVYSMDFSQLPEIAGGGALAAVTSVTASPAGLTVGTGTISGNTVQVTLSGGTDGILYQVSFTATTNRNPPATLVGIGYLLVDDQ